MKKNAIKQNDFPKVMNKQETKDKVLMAIKKICLAEKKSPLQVSEELIAKLNEAKKK